MMEWGKLFKSSSGDKLKQGKQRKTSADTALLARKGSASAEASHDRHKSPARAEQPVVSRSALSSPVLTHPKTLTQIVQLTKDQPKLVANAAAAAINRSLVEVLALESFDFC